MTDASGSETRQRDVARTVRYNRLEDGLIRCLADQAGLPVAAYIRSASLGCPPLRQRRGPTADHRIAAVMLAELGRTKTAFQSAAQLVDAQLAEQAIRDFSEYRLVLLLALGMKP